MPRPPHPPWFDLPHNISKRVQIMELLIMQFFLASRHFIPHSSKYSLQHPVLKSRDNILKVSSPAGLSHSRLLRMLWFQIFRMYALRYNEAVPWVYFNGLKFP
jgi:hypothetical protein